MLSSQTGYGTLSDGEGDKGTRNELGALNGVMIPCLLNILGVILFLRLGWAVGHAGWVGTLAMFAVGETLALLTLFSLSAIVSNGKIKGGGSYYMISRCLGPEFGGAIGLLFYCAYAVGTCFYVIGFATEIVDTFFILEDGDSKRLWVSFVSSIALACVMIISLIGAGFFTKINGFVLFIQFGSIVVGIVSMIIGTARELEGGGTYEGQSLGLLRNNSWTDFTIDEKCDGLCSFSIVFAIIFPAMTGIMEGANLSGDLKDPSGMIGPGTLAAVFFAIITYVTLIFSFAGGFPRETLKMNMSPMQDVSPSKYIIIVGIAISAGSSALGSAFGGARIVQALARDQLPFPGLAYFAKGSKNGDEPRRAVFLTWFIAQCGCLIGDLDVISPIISSFFCMSYAAVNFSCLLLEISGTPNFRPRFRFYSRYSAGVGCLLNIGVLFYLNVVYAFVAIFVLLVLIVWIAFKGPVKDWGDVSQAIMFHQVRKYLLRLDERKEHAKFWRPSVLLLINNQHDLNSPVIKFCNCLKKGGLYVLGSVVVGDLEVLSKEVLALRRSMMTMIQREKIKALPQVAISPDARNGFQNLMLCSGLGGMRPNTVVLPMIEEHLTSVNNDKGYYQRFALSLLSWSGNDDDRLGRVDESEKGSFAGQLEFTDVIKDTLRLGMNILIACNFDSLKPISSRRTRIVDVYLVGKWIPSDLDGTLSLMLQLAHIISISWGSARKLLRFVNVISQEESEADALFELKQLSQHTRIGAQCMVVRSRSGCLSEVCSQMPLHEQSQVSSRSYSMLDAARDEESQAKQTTTPCEFYTEMNELVLGHSCDSDLVFMVLPNPHEDNYLQSVRALVSRLPPTILVGSGRRTNVIPQEL